jgi:radical SAM superfamily enzyme YgiQ (UPF0313 family)
MHEANFRTVFIGLETPNVESLGETRKVQNVRGDSMAAKIDRIRDAGLIVEGGFMVGFDHDGPDIVERQRAFISETRIARAAVSILTAIPTTPLYERLKAEGRLRLADADCNFAPAGMSSAELRQGYLDLTRQIYDARAYFERVFGAWGSSAGLRRRVAERARRERAPLLRERLRAAIGTAVLGLRLLGALARDGEWAMAVAYLRIWRDYRRHGVPGIGLAAYVGYAAVHWHAYRFYRLAREGGMKGFSTYSYTSDGTGPAPVAG